MNCIMLILLDWKHHYQRYSLAFMVRSLSGTMIILYISSSASNVGCSPAWLISHFCWLEMPILPHWLKREHEWLTRDDYLVVGWLKFRGMNPPWIVCQNGSVCFLLEWGLYFFLLQQTTCSNRLSRRDRKDGRACNLQRGNCFAVNNARIYFEYGQGFEWMKGESMLLWGFGIQQRKKI